MNRAECEKVIEQKFREIVDIYHEYNPDGNYLSLTYNDDSDDGWVQANNRYWEDGEDFDYPIDFSKVRPLKIEEHPFDSGMVQKIVTGFTKDELDEIHSLYYKGDREGAEEAALQILNKRNNNIGTCWHNGYGIYRFNAGESGVTFTIGSSCD